MQDRSSIYTKVGEIMTNKVGALGLEDLIVISIFDYEIWFILQDKLVTVTSDTSILHAMQLMTGTSFIRE